MLCLLIRLIKGGRIQRKSEIGAAAVRFVFSLFLFLFVFFEKKKKIISLKLERGSRYNMEKRDSPSVHEQREYIKVSISDSVTTL